MVTEKLVLRSLRFKLGLVVSLVVLSLTLLVSFSTSTALFILSGFFWVFGVFMLIERFKQPDTKQTYHFDVLIASSGGLSWFIGMLGAYLY